MEDHNVKVTVLESGCPHYQIGDEIYFDGAFINVHGGTERDLPFCLRSPSGWERQKHTGSVP